MNDDITDFFDSPMYAGEKTAQPPPEEDQKQEADEGDVVTVQINTPQVEVTSLVIKMQTEKHTIGDLKTQFCEEHPSRPKLKSVKFLYKGKLLLDT
jgi:hypothetical protein